MTWLGPHFAAQSIFAAWTVEHPSGVVVSRLRSGFNHLQSLQLDPLVCGVLCGHKRRLRGQTHHWHATVAEKAV